MSDSVRQTALDVLDALPDKDQAQIFHALGASIILTDHKIFEIYEDGENVFVQVASRGAFEAVGDDTMWWATVPGEANPHFTDEGLEPYRIGDESEYQPFEEADTYTLADLDGTDDEASWVQPGYVLDQADVEWLRNLKIMRAQS